mgnify:CR=1 FL=1
MLKLLVRYIKFAGTSVIGTIVDTLVLWVLSDFVFHKGKVQSRDHIERQHS